MAAKLLSRQRFVPLFVLGLWVLPGYALPEPNQTTETITTVAPEAPSSPITRKQASLEENPELILFMDLPDVVSGSLTETTRQTTPAAVTVISQEDIQASGARNLFELLEMYVPNFYWVRHSKGPQHMGLRGLIHDRDDKYLLLVNGRIMNERSANGALSERDMPMLRDIHHIEVVRGPASSLYGPGALAMVISIYTDSALTFEGTEVAQRTGVKEEFYTGEFKIGRKTGANKGLFLYGGISAYPGASTEDSPLFYSYPRYQNNVQSYTGEEAQNRHWADNAAYRGLPKLKMHGQYNHDDLEVWARYTRGGTHLDEIINDFDPQRLDGYGYQQGAVQSRLKHEFSDTFSTEVAFGYDLMTVANDNNYGYREDEYHSRLLAKWKPHEKHSFAFGGEWSHEEFGLAPLGFPHDRNTGSLASYYGLDHPRWVSDQLSLFGEYQYNITKHWTTFISGRMDQHTLVKPLMISPRGALVYTPTEKDAIKLMVSRAVRANLGEDMIGIYRTTGEKTEPEKLTSYELRYERQQTRAWLLAASVFNYKTDILGYSWYSPNGNGIKPLGIMKVWGVELESSYSTEKTKFTASHSFTKLIDFQATPDGELTFLTAAGNGYGKDLANWPNHMSKLTGSYYLTKPLRLDSSLRVHWGFPGARDHAEWSEKEAAPVYPWWRRYSLGYTKPFEPAAFFDLGLNYQVSKNLEARIDAYNILGWFNIDWNKRMYLSSVPGNYRSEAPAFAFSLSYKF